MEKKLGETRANFQYVWVSGTFLFIKGLEWGILSRQYYCFSLNNDEIGDSIIETWHLKVDAPFIPTLSAANIYTETLLTQLWSLYDNTCTIGTKEQCRNINDIWNLWNVFYLIIHRNIFLCKLFYDKMTKKTMSLKLKKPEKK